ncbi:unnamed protein product [Effrenium voratum]|uniref:Uncharacterized protein n=1 Tax=Effrenium voratum TaxID=2562239 RepID=A0AA36IGC3_9DINO|nr:unnamed protein product [Effrenium voratum]
MIWVEMAVLLAALLPLASTVRTLQAESAVAEGYKVPRLCSNSLFSSDNCCACGKRNGERYDDKLGTWIDTCQWVNGKGVWYGKACCEVWAADCEENEWQYRHGLQRDCKVTQECGEAECSEVYEALASAKERLKKAQRERPRTISLQDNITGVSNTGTMCHCACGAVVDAEALTCQSLNEKALVCPEVRPCCTDLEDCGFEDPWRQAVALSEAKRKQELSDLSAMERTLKTEVRDLTALFQECYKGCKKQHQRVCVDDLKATESSGIFGKVTVQEAAATERLQKMARSHAVTSAERDAELQRLNAHARERHRARDRDRAQQWRRQQLVKLNNFASGAMKALDKAVQREECCKCQKLERSTEPGFFSEWSLITDFCSAPSCQVYGGSCSRTEKSFCGRRYTACPGDHEYYSR